MSQTELTILTLPVPDGPKALQQQLWLAARQLNYWRQGKQPPKYGGHYAVTRSLVEGSAKAKLPVNYNPRRMLEVAPRVHVPGGVQALRQAILMKKRGMIQQLTCGPNIVVRASDYDSILASPEIDAVVNHVDWACEFWAKDHPELRARCLSWGAGVDTSFWKPSERTERPTILVFDKRRKDQDHQRVNPYVAHLQHMGWAVKILTRCGNIGYSLEQFRGFLHQSALMVGFTVGSESQGLAWAEAWAANVPTLILQQTENVYQGLRYRCNTAPFLTPATGAFFHDLHDFKRQFELWRSGQHVFCPRDWVLANMSDEVCAENLYNQLISRSPVLAKIKATGAGEL